MLINSTQPLGTIIDYSLAPDERLDYIKLNSPIDIDFASLLATFKKDIILDNIVELIEDVDVYYIQTSLGRGDELYYFSVNGKFFHGEKIWSRYHGFLPFLDQIECSAVVEAPCWFVGSRDNYTHQLIDFFPNLLLQSELRAKLPVQSVNNIFGSPNSILKSFKQFPLFCSIMAESSTLFLEALGFPSFFECWSIRRIRFKQLYLVRHLSIFRAFSLVEDALQSTGFKKARRESAVGRRLLYLSRKDQRVINQAEIISYLHSLEGSAVLDDILQLSYLARAEYISSFELVLLPPGSDNINGLCFSSDAARLIQMISVPVANLLDNPFYSYAGLRYVLPFLHRLTFCPSISSRKSVGPNVGEWCIQELEKLLQRKS